MIGAMPMDSSPIAAPPPTDGGGFMGSVLRSMPPSAAGAAGAAMGVAPSTRMPTGGSNWNPSWGENAAGQYDYNGVSQDAALATGWAPSLSDAESQWFAANPGYSQYDTGGASTAGPQLGGGPGSQAVAPGAAAGPSGVMQSALGSPDTIASAAPLPFSAFGDIPTIAPTFASAASVDPSQVGKPNAAHMGGYGAMNAATVDPASAGAFTSQYEKAISDSLAPTFANQRQDLNDSLASRGIFNSSAAQDQQTRLAGQQAATLAGADAPIISQGFGAAQQDALTNQNANQAANLTNFQAGYGTAETNAGYNQQANLAGYGAYERALLANAGYGQQANLYNADAANNANAANASTYLDIAKGDQQNYNGFMGSLLGYGSSLGGAELGSYLSSFSPNGATTSILEKGAGAAGSAYNAAYNGYQGIDTGALAGAFRGMGSGGGGSAFPGAGIGGSSINYGAVDMPVNMPATPTTGLPGS